MGLTRRDATPPTAAAAAAAVVVVVAAAAAVVAAAAAAAVAASAAANCAAYAGSCSPCAFCHKWGNVAKCFSKIIENSAGAQQSNPTKFVNTGFWGRAMCSECSASSEAGM